MGNEIPLVATHLLQARPLRSRPGLCEGLQLPARSVWPSCPTFRLTARAATRASSHRHGTGFFLPAKTPDEIAKKLNVAINEILKIQKWPRISSNSALNRSTLIRELPTRCFDPTSSNGGAWSKPLISSRIERLRNTRT